MNHIVLDNKEFVATDICPPCLIHGYDGSGASQFTVSLAANLIALGKNVMFFCARIQGVDSLRAELGGHSLDGVLIIEPGNENLFLEEFSHQGKKCDYVIVKNVEEYTGKLFDVVAESKNIILSGDFDKLRYIERLRPPVSHIFFSGSSCLVVPQQLPPLEKYEGYLLSEASQGKIRLQIY